MIERETQQLRDGAGEAFSAAFEMIVTPTLFGLLGWFIDSRIGTTPLFALILGFTVLTYEIWKLYTQYNADMDAELAARRAGYGASGGTSEAGA